MKKNGFTLMELLGVIVILALLILVAFPNVINSIKSTNDFTEEKVIVLIENSAKLYMRSNLDKIPDEEKIYCITIEGLIGTGNLDEEIINSSDIITIDHIVEAQYDVDKKEFLFNISEECEGELLIKKVKVN